MIRNTKGTASRREWLSAAIIPLALAACGGESAKPAEAVQAPATPASTPVIPASGPVVTSDAGATVPRAVRYEDAEALFKAGNYTEAKTLFKSYAESKPANVFGWYMLGLSSWKSGDLNGAVEAFDSALTRDPKHVKSLLNSARVLMDLGRDSEALERVNTARSLDSTSAEGIRLLARAQHRLGHIDEAVSAYREALVRDESDVWAMNNLGMLYIEQKDPQSALGPLARAVQLKPESPIFQNNLGMALELTGHVTEARRAYDDAIKADSGYTKAQANARRLGDVVVDSTGTIGVDLKELAEVFRQQVKMWKESVKQPTG
jgi:predicted Zn-dependent protease